MKLNIANPSTGAQKLLEFDDEKKMRIFYDKKISSEVDVDSLGDEWKGYRVKITGGNDKQGFPMMQGVLVNQRVRLLLDKNSISCFRARRSGERKRKSIRGAIVGPDISVISLIITKKGEQEIPGLTDRELPQRLGPKRASRIRKLFNLTKEDDVRKFVVRRKLANKPDTHKGKAPKIQRLVTPVVLQRKRRREALKKRWADKARKDAAEYAKLLAQRRKESRAKRQAVISKRRSSVRKDAPTSGEAKAIPPAAAKPVATSTVQGVKAGAGKTQGGQKQGQPQKGAAPPQDTKKGPQAGPKAGAAHKGQVQGGQKGKKNQGGQQGKGGAK